MTASGEVLLTSRENPLLVKLRRLARDGASYRKAGEVWIEGEHLCRAALAHGRSAAQVLVSASAWARPALRALARQAGPRIAIASDALFAEASGLEHPGEGIGMLLALETSARQLEPGRASVVLDRLQDAGNAGSVLRSAAAFGFAQVLALKGTVALWSPKVLRAGMGAHFGLRLVEGLLPAGLDGLGVPLVATSSHAEASLTAAALPRPCAFVFGNEGQGIAAELAERCALVVRIPQPGGEESLNVAAAAAICLYEAARRPPQ